jgi:NAD(P)-dependent dehydrogenase (short-subunit alcohol dehydrogenase family)
MTDEDWLRVISVNLSGAFFMARVALDHMIERGTGRSISVSSVIGETGNIGQANYAASKSGLFGLTKSLAKEAIFQLNRAERPGRRRSRAYRERGDPGLRRDRHARHHP